MSEFIKQDKTDEDVIIAEIDEEELARIEKEEMGEDAILEAIAKHQDEVTEALKKKVPVEEEKKEEVEKVEKKGKEGRRDDCIYIQRKEGNQEKAIPLDTISSTTSSRIPKFRK